jgi:thiamine-monophosphate kinase
VKLTLKKLSIETEKQTDLLVVTGDIGAAYMGLQVLEREKQVFQVNPNSQPDLDAYTYLIERQLKPEARKDIRTLLHALEIKPTYDRYIRRIIFRNYAPLQTICCRLTKTNYLSTPINKCVCEEFNIDSTTVAINGGRL